MSARATFNKARSLYRRGLREPAVTCPGTPELACRNVWARPSSRRPLCDEGVAIASRLHPRSAEFLARRDEPRMVSAARLMFEYDNPAMYEVVRGQRVDVGHPFKREALRKLRSRLFAHQQCRIPQFRWGPTGFPLCELAQHEMDIGIVRIYRDMLAAEMRAAA